jgi:hypothetical protein
MWVELSDGRTLGVPYAWFPRLLNATPKQREAVEIGRFGLHWEEIDEDISIAGLLEGRRDQTICKDNVSSIYSVEARSEAHHVDERKVDSRMHKNRLLSVGRKATTQCAKETPSAPVRSCQLKGKRFSGHVS